MKLILSLDPLRVSLTGIGRYTYELAKGLQSCEQLESLKFQFLLGWVDGPQTLLQKYHGEQQVKSRDSSPSALKTHLYHGLRAGYRTISPVVKGLVSFPFKDHIYHSPNYEIPQFAGRCVSTVHDLSILRVPQYHPVSRVRHQQAMFPSLIARGSLFITDSEFSKNELLEFFPAARGRVVSVPLGVDPLFRVRDAQLISPTLERYGLVPGNYTLSVGTIEPRKNLERLIDAYQQLPLGMRQAFPLVLIGGSGWNSEHLHQRIAAYAQEGWLKYLRFIPDQDMASIYSGARVFACISHYEGFGLPVLEAMASGVAVIASNVASLPEVGGDCVHYVDPNQTEQITQALSTVLEDDSYREQLSQKGLRRAQLFHWDRTVRETVQAYQQID